MLRCSLTSEVPRTITLFAHSAQHIMTSGFSQNCRAQCVLLMTPAYLHHVHLQVADQQQITPGRLFGSQQNLLSSICAF